jgi:pilus assembly protein CpaE
MTVSRSIDGATKTQVVVVTADSAFEEMARSTFGTSPKIAVTVMQGALAEVEADISSEAATVVVIDLDAAPTEELEALDRLVSREAGLAVVPVVRNVDANLARTLVQMRVADFLVKPVSAVDLVRTCARVAQGPQGSAAAAPTEAQIYTFLPAVGGAGVTTLAIASAMILQESGPRGKSSTCLVDLDFQHGSCADYLDIEPRLNLAEIEPRPDRLDRQLLEVMLSHHASGLAVVAAPHHLAEMRSFDPDVVTRLLDLVSSNFDYVVFDMPRTWFTWTDSVLLGSNHLYVVCEMTVPGLRHAKRLVEAIHERLGEGPKPQVVVNRFEQSLFSSGLRRADVQQVLGESFAACVPNQYALVREAIDRGVPLDEVKPGNKVTVALKRLILPPAAAKAAARGETAAPRKAKLLSLAR